MKKKAIIISIKGTKLSNRERLLISKEKPWGIILFNRNIKSIDQIQKLVQDIRKSSKDKRFPILIDEEGKKVSRLSDIFNHDFNAYFFGNIYKKDKRAAISLYKIYLKYYINILLITFFLVMTHLKYPFHF